MGRYDNTKINKYTTTDKERVGNKNKFNTTVYLKVPGRNDDMSFFKKPRPLLFLDICTCKAA